MKSFLKPGINSCNRRGQMEAAGLVVIVILVTIGMLLLAQFSLRENTEKKIFTRKGLAYSTVSALMKSTVDDPSCVPELAGASSAQVGKDLLEDCAVNSATASFEGYSQYRCDGRHSCRFLEGHITSLLQQTLGTWNKNYEFISRLVEVEGTEPKMLLGPIVGGQGCLGARERDSSELFFLHTDAGLAESILYICD